MIFKGYQFINSVNNINSATKAEQKQVFIYTF